MNNKVLIVEDQFVEANDIQIILRRTGYSVCGIARSVEIAESMIEKERPDLVLLDIFLKGKRTGIDLARQLRKDNIAFIYLSANSNEEILSAAKTTEPYGFIVKPFREKDLLVTLEIARYRHEHSYESRTRREAAILNQLDTIDVDAIRKGRLLTIARVMQPEIQFDFLCVMYPADSQEESNLCALLRVGFDEYQQIGANEMAVISNTPRDKLNAMLGVSRNGIENGIFNDKAFERIARATPFAKLLGTTFDVKSLLLFSFFNNTDPVCSLLFCSRRPDCYNPEHLALLDRAGDKIARVIVPGVKPIQAETSPVPPAILKRTHNFYQEGIVGNSHLLLNVFDLIVQVAPFDTSVLILGESGTGKEKIADCIHKLSSRRLKPLVKLNCAALPAALIESELFGHEKGSFTGATDKRIGKFEQADGGTILLDEIGEMPVDLQVKLLRVLQEKEIEPIGARSPVKIDVRVIASTNRNLEKEVAEGRFRLDLYYRLNVFPIGVPPLRDRPEDIAELAQHFVNVCNRKSGKKISGISEKVLTAFSNYHWPGNVRELENLVERAVLLTKGTVIDDVMLLPAQPGSMPLHHGSLSTNKTFHENERDYIVAILKKCNGKVWGIGGAAEILGIPPTTLKSKMKKLGIDKEISE